MQLPGQNAIANDPLCFGSSMSYRVCTGRKFWDYIGVKISLQLLGAIDAADGSDTMFRDSEKLPRSMRSIILSFRAELQKKGSVETISFENELELHGE